jgi:hypothetical protein
MNYINKPLTLIASWLYNNEPSNKARLELYKATEQNIHPKGKITANFSKETLETMDRVQKILDGIEKKRK